MSQTGYAAIIALALCALVLTTCARVCHGSRTEPSAALLPVPDVPRGAMTPFKYTVSLRQ